MSFLIGGVDEVGRGALAGPLFAVVAVFNSEKEADWRKDRSPILGVDDSKNLSFGKRAELYQRILRSPYIVDLGVGKISVEEINRRGIEDANKLVFLRALENLKHEPNWLLVDGDQYSLGWSISRQQHRPKGDSYWWPVGAASILAKVIRDEYMTELWQDFPHYRWASNMGYGTEDHREAIKKYGPCLHHRTQFIRKIMGGENGGYATGQG